MIWHDEADQTVAEITLTGFLFVKKDVLIYVRLTKGRWS